jgi:hypothetical protein
MQSQSKKFWSNTFSKVLSASAFCAIALAPASSWATISVTSVTSSGKTIPNFANGSYFYPAFASGADGSQGTVVPPTGVIDIAKGFSFVDLSSDSNPNTGVGAGNPGVIYFNVSSTNSAFAQPAAIAVFTGGTQSGTPDQLVPIASYDQSMCGNGDGGNCLVSAVRGSTYGSEYFYAANYGADQTVTIGLDVQSICRSFRTGSADVPAICNTQLLGSAAATPTSAVPLLLNIAIFNQADLIDLGNSGLPPLMQLPAVQDGPIQVSLDFVTLKAGQHFHPRKHHHHL